jgi:hypothetical protein
LRRRKFQRPGELINEGMGLLARHDYLSKC